MKKSIKTPQKIIALIVLIATVLTAAVVPASASPAPALDFTVDAASALLINLDNEQRTVLYSKNADEKRAPASLTKIATAATALSKGVDLDAKTTVSYNAIHALDGTGSAMANLQVGEELTIRQLLYLIMLHSAGEACNVLAEYVAGSIEEYVKMMNEWAKSIGCENTNFVNPVGIDDENHYTTANDLAKMTIKALENSDFEEISTTVTYKLPATNKSPERTFTHRNSMLNKGTGYYYKYAEGIKTGTTTNAGRCVITRASKDGYNYLCVVMGGILKDYTNDGLEDVGCFFDAKNLFEWAFENFRIKTIAKSNQVVATIPIKNAKGSDELQLVPQSDISSLVPKALDSSAVIYKLHDDAPKVVNAPITKGTEVAKADIIYANETIATVTLVAANDVERSIPLLIYNTIKDLMSTIWAKIVLAIIVLLIIAYIIITIVYNVKRKKKKMRQVKDYRKM